MLLRFSLYGFLKNQRYFEPFLLLVFLEKGLDFFAVGLLIGFRDLMVTLLEIPSGAIADVLGRRLSMVLSFAAYILSFVLFALAGDIGLLTLAMAFFAVGEAFRTGTHKAMIFSWLRSQGREHERTRIYGITRSWSKFGSAVSSLIAAGLVLWSGHYSTIFLLTIPAYVLDMLNVGTYQRSVEGAASSRSPREVVSVTVATLRHAVRHPPLRRLMLESAGFEGLFHSIKDYLQPVLVAAAVVLLLEGREAVLIGVVYAALFLLAGAASRRAHRVVKAAGSEDAAARRLWGGAIPLFGVMALAGCMDWSWLLVAAFVLLHILQNLWRPVLVSRFDDHADPAHGATVLSVESQSRRLATVVAAPLIGLAVDASGAFWPLGVAGLASAVFFFGSSRKRPSP